ncbi:glycosyltransferase family 4 protein [Calidithermus chliarophilus]|uniref:glycosyltransferase family 4 protein n=1 Tax=Calidithermus chliarophilus TaxID=52023 RepID=UPI0003FFE3E9|nr:glycosyltransferase family 1 protein [Calidithermus chliarophilus]
MRVGFFTYGMDRSLSGIGRYAVELTRALRRLEPGLEVVLLNPYPRSELGWYREFETYPLPILARVPLAATLGNLMLHQAARRLGLDVLHDPCGIAPFLVPFPGYRRVVTVHDAVPLATPDLQPLATRLVFRTLVPWTRFSADAVLTVSHHAAADLERLAGIPRAKLHVTYNGVNPPPPMGEAEVRGVLERLGIEPPYFLYVGNLVARKNLPRLVQAFRLLRQEIPEARLVIVGARQWKSHEVFQHDLTNVLVPGYVSDDDLHALYYGARALAFPSLYEGFGIPAVEAMAHGTPVLTSNASCLPEVAGDAALLVDPASTESIRDGLRTLWHDAALREELRRKGLERAKIFTWEQTARATLEVYRRLVNS